MEGFKGTPGPWVASEYYSDSVTILNSDGFSVAEAEHFQILEGYEEKGFTHWASSEDAHRKISDEEQAANARLIAAAPELLEALQDALPWLNSGLSRGCHEKAVAAIEKALGH